MKKPLSARAVAFGGLGAALSTLCVIGAYYIPNVSVSFNVLASLGILLPLTQSYYAAAFLAYAVTAGIGGAVTNIHVLPFVLVAGLLPPLTLLLQAKIKFPWLRAVIKFVYAMGTFGLLYGAAHLFVIDLTRLKLDALSPTVLYFLFNAVYLIAIFVYDVGIRYFFPYLKKLTDKIK